MFTIRNFTWDDFPALLELIRAAPGDPQQDLAQDEQFARKWLEQPGCYPERDYFLAFQGPRAVGYSRVDPEPPIGRAVVSGAVHPDVRGQGLGRQLLSRAVGHARDLGLTRVHVPTSPDDIVARRLLSEGGFAPVRMECHMRREDGVTPPLALPRGYWLRHLRSGEEPAFAALQNAVFAANWGFCPNTPEQVAYRVRLPGSSLEGILLVVNRKKPIAYCWTRISTSAQGRVGVIAMTGVLDHHRGKGLGKAVILAGLNYLTGQGIATVDLNVDQENESALKLYASLGFRPLHKTQWYELIL